MWCVDTGLKLGDNVTDRDEIVRRNFTQCFYMQCFYFWCVLIITFESCGSQTPKNKSGLKVLYEKLTSRHATTPSLNIFKRQTIDFRLYYAESIFNIAFPIAHDFQLQHVHIPHHGTRHCGHCACGGNCTAVFK